MTQFKNGNHHLEELKVEEVIGVVGVVEMKADVSDVEFCHYSRRNGVPLSSRLLLLSSLFFLPLLRLSAFRIAEKAPSERFYAYRLLRSKGFDSCGLLIQRHRNKNAARFMCNCR